MARPCKKKRICAEPSYSRFGPLVAEAEAANVQRVWEKRSSGKAAREIVMTLDEYECMRLIDYEGLTQEQSAVQMDAARTTVQALYGSARRKLAACIVEGRSLRIEGGNFILCERQEGCCHRYCTNGIQMIQRKGEDITMRIGVTYENGQIFQHFGKTEQFKIYDISDSTVVQSMVVDTNGSGHGALAGFLQENGVDTLICGGIGGGAQNALAAAGIRIYCGVTGRADEAVAALLQGTLVYATEATCDHHDHEHHHHEGGCGSHGCGSHGCHE